MPPQRGPWTRAAARPVPFWANFVDIDHALETVRFDIDAAQGAYNAALELACVHAGHGHLDRDLVRRLAEARRELGALELVRRELEQIRDALESAP